MIPIGESFVTDQEDNHCFACSQSNGHGLRMRFTRTGDRTAECRYTVPQHFCGFETVVHGGIQAALLDEIMSVTTNIHRPKDQRVHCATIELNVRYRRPVPIGREILLRGELVQEDERDLHIQGAILNGDGEPLTTATGRWRKLQRTTGFEGRPNNA